MDAISEAKENWKRIDRALIPEKLLVEMPQPECKGLTLLTDVMINATVCRLGPAQGQVTARYADDIELVLDVAETIELGLNGTRSRRAYRQLVLWAQNTLTREKRYVCVVAKGIPVPSIDDCVSFVMWAEAGFPNPPYTVVDGILYLRDPELYARKAGERSLAIHENMRIEKERRELVISQRRARCQAQQELELQRKRVRDLGWRELIAEHESVSPSDDDISTALYHLRISLLTLPVPGHPIGQH